VALRIPIPLTSGFQIALGSLTQPDILILSITIQMFRCVDHVKLDIEGAEPRALAGASKHRRSRLPHAGSLDSF
jgi:hypothetical protein